MDYVPNTKYYTQKLKKRCLRDLLYKYTGFRDVNLSDKEKNIVLDNENKKLLNRE